MKYKKQISKNYRKVISLLLLLYFITSPLLFAFPTENCSSSCPLDMNNKSVLMQMNTTGTYHCKMMKEIIQKAKHQNSCDIKFDIAKCDIDKQYTPTSNYMIPLNYKANINFQQATIIDSYLFAIKYQSFTIREVNPKRHSTPIFIIVDSFLI